MNLTHIAKLRQPELFTTEDQFVIFSLDRQDFALPAGFVDRIIRSIFITSMPGIEENIMGVINVQGQAIPVFNIRKIFNLPLKEIRLSDMFILAHISGQIISIVVDSVKGITNRKDQKIIPAGKIFPGMEKTLEGLIFFEDGVILIYNPEKLFSIENLGKINMKVLEQKMGEINDVKNKARSKRPGQKNAAAKRGEIKKKNRRIQKNKKTNRKSEYEQNKKR